MAIKRFYFEIEKNQSKVVDLSKYGNLKSMSIRVNFIQPYGYNLGLALGYYFQAQFINGEELMQTNPTYLNNYNSQGFHFFNFDRDTLLELAVYSTVSVGANDSVLGFYVELEVEDVFHIRRK